MNELAPLDEMIEACKRLAGPRASEDIAAAAAPLIDQAIKATARAGQTPSGEPWLPRKKDGAQALQHVAEQIETKAYGPFVRVTLTGPAVYSHVGAGIPRRQVLPDGGTEIPASVEAAALKAAAAVFERATGGRQ